MTGFSTDLYTRIFSAAELNGGKQLYQLTSELGYHSEILGFIAVPMGMITDFASIPRVAFQYLDPEDPCILYPSVVHDYLYQLGGTLPTGQTYTRERADNVLREAMQACHARWDQHTIVYRMVRLFGGSHWKTP